MERYPYSAYLLIICSLKPISILTHDILKVFIQRVVMAQRLSAISEEKSLTSVGLPTLLHAHTNEDLKHMRS